MPAHTFPTPLGPCSLEWEGNEITRFGLLTSAPESSPLPEWLEPVMARVQNHLQVGDEDFTDVPLAWSRVSSFQQRTYRAAQQIKPGQTATYGDLARAIGEAPTVSRAIGTALGQNPWPLLVPCHRLVGADGRMTGFSAPGGIATKLKLLAIEGSEMFAV